MNFRLLAFLLILGLSPSARAQVAPADDDVRRLETCLAEATNERAGWPRSCIGILSDPCMNEPGGESNTGMARCLGREARAWRGLLVRYAAQLRARESPTQRTLLDAALAVGEQWEDSRCDYDASIYEGGSLERVVSAICRRDTVAERALDLHARLSEYDRQ